MSARISGEKKAESKAASLLRGFPLSQVQSASEKGSILAGVVVAGGASCVSKAAFGAKDAGAMAVFAGTAVVAEAWFGAERPRKAFSSSAIRALICSSSATIAALSEEVAPEEDVFEPGTFSGDCCASRRVPELAAIASSTNVMVSVLRDTASRRNT